MGQQLQCRVGRTLDESLQVHSGLFRRAGRVLVDNDHNALSPAVAPPPHPETKASDTATPVTRATVVAKVPVRRWLISEARYTARSGDIP
jgi:hypothetical protein